MGKLAEVFWDGLTLKHVSDKTFIRTYSIFIGLIALFELFLGVLYGVSVYFFNQFGYEPDVSFYLCGPILFLVMMTTFFIVKTIFRKGRFNLA